MRDLAQLLDAAGLANQAAAAAYLGVTPRTLRRWLSGQIAPPASVVILLGLMVRLGISAERALDKA